MRILAGLLLSFFLAACGGGTPPRLVELEALPDIQKLHVIESPSDLLIESHEDEEPAPILKTRPAKGKISSPFGMRKLPGYKTRIHKGIDIMANRGTPVLASGDGEVIFAGRMGTFGNLVAIRHSNGWVTRYAHLEKITVQRGRLLESGAVLGTVGKTGRTTGYNLHFEVLVGEAHVDPLTIVEWA